MSEHSTGMVRRCVEIAVSAERLEDRYRHSAEFKARIESLTGFLMAAVPALPVKMSDADLMLWMRRLVLQAHEDARDAEVLNREIMRRMITEPLSPEAVDEIKARFKAQDLLGFGEQR